MTSDVDDPYAPPVIAITADEVSLPNTRWIGDLLHRWTKTFGLPKRHVDDVMLRLEIIDEGRIRFYYENGDTVEVEGVLPEPAMAYIRGRDQLVLTVPEGGPASASPPNRTT